MVTSTGSSPLIVPWVVVTEPATTVVFAGIGSVNATAVASVLPVFEIVTV